MNLLLRSIGIALRVVVAAGCCWGIWGSWQLARADYLFEKNSEDSVRAAIRAAPDQWLYYMRLADFDPEHASELLESALRLDPYDAQADMELGLLFEAVGNFNDAEKSFLAAWEVDRTYPPRWSLANFYFRRGNMPAFWMWARRAAEMPADEIGPLFELCWRASPDPEQIMVAVLNNQPELLKHYLEFLRTKNQLHGAAIVAPRLLNVGNPAIDRPLLFDIVNRLTYSGDGPDAIALWHLLIARGWVVADATVPNNGDFTREPLPVSFDWSLPEDQGMHSWPGPSGLETEFSGTQPEDCTVAEQVATLPPGNYFMSFEYHTAGIPAATGLHWQIIDGKSNMVSAISHDLSSDTLIRSGFDFSVPPDTPIVRIRLAYQRALGTPRISGSLTLLSTKIQLNSKSTP